MRFVMALLIWTATMHSQVPAGKGYGVKEIKDGLYRVTDGAYKHHVLGHEGWGHCR